MPTLERLINPQILLGFVRELTYDQWSIRQYLPDRQLDDNQFRYATTQLADSKATMYRAWDTESKLRGRQGLSYATAELAPTSEKMLMTEEQYLKLRAIEKGDWTNYVDQIFADIQTLARGIAARFAIDTGKLLSTGIASVVFTDNGGASWTETIDFGVPSGNKPTATTLWSDIANADPVTDFTTWVRAYSVLNKGLRPAVALISTQVQGYLQRNAAMRSLLASSLGAPSIVSPNAVQAELDTFNLPRLVVFDEQAVDETGATVNLLPANKVIFLPADYSSVGELLKGVTATGLDLVEAGTITQELAGGISALTWKDNDPPKRWELVEDVALPYLANPNRLMIATVA